MTERQGRGRSHSGRPIPLRWSSNTPAWWRWWPEHCRRKPCRRGSGNTPSSPLSGFEPLQRVDKNKKRTDVVLSEFVLKRLDKFFNLRKSVLAYPHSCVCLLTGHNHGCRHTQKNPACSHKCQRAGTVSCSQHIRQCLAEKTNSLDSKTNFFREIKFW